VRRQPDAVVVGAGIVGAACALALARDGLRVLVLEERCAGCGTTAAAMGHLVAMDDSPAQLALTALSLRLWAELAEELPADCEHDPCGTLWLAADDEEMAQVAAKAELYRAHGLAAGILDAAQLAAAEPELRRGLAGALHVPGDSVIYPPNAVRFLLARAAERGAEVWEGFHVSRLAPGGSVEGHGERITAPIVINAAGAAAPLLTPGLAIAPRKGHLVITDRYPGFCRHQLVELGYLKSAHGAHGTLGAHSAPESAPGVGTAAASVAFNVQPRATSQLLIGSSRELVGWDASLNRALERRMIERAVGFLPRLAGLAALRTWTGFRPATADNLPLLGAWPAQPGLWIAAGHEGLGITTSLATGCLVADLVAGRAPALDCGPFSPGRLAPGAAAALELEPHTSAPADPSERSRPHGP
jgi:glycine/D-amino acid oxidase-like deaminating enzyme